MSPLALEIVSDEQGFRSLESEWCDLLGRVRRRGYFQTFEWVWRSWQHTGRVRGHTLFIVVGRRAGRVVLIWPLVRFRKLLLQTAEWIGSEHACRRDVFVEDAPEAGEWVEAAWSHVTKTVDFMWLNRMSDDAVLVPLIHRVKSIGTHVEEAPYVDWADWPDWEAYWRKRTKNVRKSLARRRRRFGEQGKVEFGFLTSLEEIRETLEWMRAHKAAWMKSKGLRMQDLGGDTAVTVREFYQSFVADTASASKHLRLATLTLDGNVVAAQLGFLFEGTFAAAMSAYDPAWENYSPSTLLLADLLRWSLENNCAIFDLMPYGESYKYDWAPKEAKLTTYLIPCSRRGRVLVAWRCSRLGATARRVVHLRPADIPRVIRKRFAGRSPAP